MYKCETVEIHNIRHTAVVKQQLVNSAHATTADVQVKAAQK